VDAIVIVALTGPAPAAPPKRIWFAILGAPVAWAAQGVLGVVVEGLTCTGGIGGRAALSTEAARMLEVGISGVAFLVALGALLVGMAEWRRSPDPGVTSTLARDPRDFLAATALFVSFVFALAILMTAFPMIFLPLCEATR
jgi:hypothetical protein